MKKLRNCVNGWLMSLFCCFSVASASAEWSFPAVTIAENASKPHVKVDTSGNGVITWLECDGKYSNIKAKTFLKNGTWSEGQTISSFEGNCSDHGAKLALDPQGNAVVIWEEQINGSKAVIKGSMLPFQSCSWMDHLTLSAPLTLSKGAEVIADFSGNGLATWINEVGKIQAASFIDSIWVLPVMDFPASGNAFNLKIAVCSKGDAIAVWEETINDEVFIMSARLPFKGNTWIPATAPLSAPGANSPQIAINKAGHAIAVWVSESGVIKTANLSSRSNSWSVPSVNLSSKNLIGSQPQIVIDQADNATIIWKATNGESSVIQSSTSSRKWLGLVQDKWSKAVNVYNSLENLSDPQLAVDDNGNIVAVWRKTISADSIIIQSSNRSLKEDWSEPINLSNEGEKADVPQISIDNSGAKTVVVWSNNLGRIQVLSSALAGPTVTGVFPNCGQDGTFVDLTGTGFLSATQVFFGATSTNFFSNSDTVILTQAPPGVGTVDIVVVTPDGSSPINPNDVFTYSSGPGVSSVSPNSGTFLGGTSVTITGTGFTGTTSVQFGTVNAPGFIVNGTGTQITVNSPPAIATEPCTVDITVTTQCGTSNDQFTYNLFNPPTISANLNPNSGAASGGTNVTITGTNFFGVTAVNFGATPATSFNVINSTTLTAISPAGTPCTTVDVTVTACGGTSAINTFDKFTFRPTPTLTSLVPSSGSPAGGTIVTITGTDFNLPATVTFGGIAGTNVQLINETTITVIAPAAAINSPCSVPVVVTVCGVASGSLPFTYAFGTPTITSVNPNSDLIFGGTPVTILGTNFDGVTAVNFGPHPAASFDVVDTTSIQAVSPGGGLCELVDIRVTACGGTSAIVPADQFTFLPPAVPAITNLSTHTGSPAGGTPVTIVGTAFFQGSGPISVHFGATAATNVVLVNSGTITADSPAGTECQTVNVTVTNCAGTSAISGGDQFTYVPAAPTVTNVSPNSGLPAGGTSVTITGTNFFGVTAVNFGANPATNVVVVNPTTITANFPAGTGCQTVDVRVTTCAGTSAISGGDQFTYTPDAPTVTSLSPNNGSPAGGTPVTISGTNFFGITAVNFGANPATNVVVVNPTTITANSPAGTECQIVNVTVTTCAGTSATSPANQFTFTTGIAPTVTGLSTHSGSPAGGTSVTITGTNFVDVTAVNFGASLATNVVVVNPTTITADSPAGTECQTVDVTVTTTCTGTSVTSPADQFTFTPDAPTVTGLSTHTGAPAGGTPVTISGTNFFGVTAVNFGANPATNIVVVNPTTITANSPAGTECQTVDVRVTTCAGTSAISGGDQFTFTPNAPTVTGLSPNTGSPAGGTPVIISGTNFFGITAVNFGANPATNVVVVNPTTITANSPAGTECQIVNVTVTTCAGTSATSSANQFTFTTGIAPTVTGLSTHSGSPAGGTSVTITGTNFVDVTAVNFGASLATNVVVVNPTTITADSPAGTECQTVDVTVTTTCTGTSATSPTDQFTFTPDAPTVTSLSPNTGSPAGGTPVTISGTNFFGVTAVNFGANPATNVVVVNPTTITANSPAGTECQTVNVTVTNCAGTSAISGGDQFTYVPDAPTITSVSPNSGSPAGGTSVTITGTNFFGVTAVNFGVSPATNVVVVNPTTITADSPAGGECQIVNVTVTTCVGTSATSSANQFTFTTSSAAPTVTGLSTYSGSPAGGTSVTITGTNFVDVTAVNFGPSPATNVIVVNPTTITADSPAGTECQIVDVTVTNCAGTSITSPADQFTYLGLIPTITDLSPSSGPVGQSVTIHGSNFISGISVDFGGNPGTGIIVVDLNTIIVTAPEASNCVVPVTVTSCGQVSNEVIFTYTGFPTPDVTGLNPSSGAAAGGNPVAITGTNFVGTTAVQFGGVDALDFTVNSPTSITATAPAGTNCEIVDITVTNCEGNSPSTGADEYFYQSIPTITGLSPNSGPASGGNSIVITGTNFIGVTQVFFGGVEASFTIDSQTSITAIAPAGDNCTFVNIGVANCAGDSPVTQDVQYTYKNLPTITGLSPNSGPVSGGNSVAITGTNFEGVTGHDAVKFGGVNAVNYSVTSPTSMIAQAPAGTNCATVDITITNCAGSTPITSIDQYTYQSVASVTNVNPNTGPASGGNSVAITGTNFDGTTAVQFGGVNASSFVVNSLTSIIAVVPAGSPGTVDITVTTCGGTSPITANDQYTYQNNVPQVPNAPSKFIGCIKENKFLNKRECILEASWHASHSPNIIAYKIYKGDKVIARIKAKSRLFFEEKLSKCSAKGYSVTAVNKAGLESNHVKLKIVSE